MMMKFQSLILQESDDEFCDYLDACIDEDENIFPAFDDCNNWNEMYQLVDSVCAQIKLQNGKK